MKNQQPKEDLDRRADGSLDIVDIFRTIQGEGPFTGHPAVFIRLAGCVLRCPGCDTDYTSVRERMTPETVIQEVERFRPTPLIVITGGEPLRQNLNTLVHILIRTNHKVQIETNGRLMDYQLPFDDINFSVVCSPKGKVNPVLARRIKAYKYIIRAGDTDDKDGLPTSVLENGERPDRPLKDSQSLVYIQPYDEHNEEKNKANIQATIESSLKFGYIISLQLHKIVGLA